MEPGRRCFCLGHWDPNSLCLLQQAGASACVCRALHAYEEIEEKTEAVDDVIDKGRA